ncbi:pachytene checkpoint protein 2 homolog [Coccinella septempunctata]|uniref:pachytene checkpoint protein 2 homolog n=1 Tax=Coccinella septempunctata TaxID=41139 RepID=UPI001D086327|nr:pachytene checkpoint protein 2 homolog [Coccinella septempunctata]
MQPITIEVVLKNAKPQPKSTIQQSISYYLKSNRVSTGNVIRSFTDDYLQNYVECIIIEDTLECKNLSNISQFQIEWYIYSADHSKPMVQNEFSPDGEINIATHLVLPNIDLVNSWENLHYESEIKDNLLRYAHTMMKFSDSGIDSNIITCNKVILLHGPPGTGKTSLCKALAHKLAVRMQDRYPSGILVEINSHSLFSRYFSESGKLVTKMFSSIKEIIENESILVCVLIDEVESLAHARDQCLSGVEPSDAIRVVNAVLTQIDQIKRYPNVLVLATSNLTKSIDLAFIDRADIKQYLGLPKTPAIYKIYLSCIKELQRIHILEDNIPFAPLNTVMKTNWNELDKYSRTLLEICEKSVGLSGRSLRKIPFIGYALFSNIKSENVEDFLNSMERAIEKEKSDRENL